MSEFVEVKTAQLEGAALDWAVAQVEKVQTTYRYGRELVADHDRGGIKLILSIRPIYSPSTDWSQGGPLIDRFNVDMTVERDRLIWAYVTDINGNPVMNAEVYGSFGSTHLIAACRAIVAAKLGGTVQVPKELLS